MPAAMLAPLLTLALLTLALLTLALLPLALAACPCPPAPAAAEVCGSDHKTYPSACDLDCTAPPGVAAAHPGPCRPADAAPGRPTNAMEEWRQFDQCAMRQCDNFTCSECGARDSNCLSMCERNCACGCLGLQTSGLDSARFNECYARECVSQSVECQRPCKLIRCLIRCRMDDARCKCGCAQQAEGTTPRPTRMTSTVRKIVPKYTKVSPTSTTSALTTTSPTSTTSTTSAPITISPASPASPAGVHAADVVWERALLVFCALVCACVCVWVCVRARAPHALLCCPVGPVSVHQVACAERSHQEAASARACGASSEPGVELTALELDSQPLCS